MTMLRTVSRRFGSLITSTASARLSAAGLDIVVRSLSTPADEKVTMDDVNSLFAEARLSLQDAVESKGTVYFEEDFNDAKEITQQTLDAFETLINSVSQQERQSLLDANRPKMAQLEQEFKNLEDELIHDD